MFRKILDVFINSGSSSHSENGTTGKLPPPKSQLIIGEKQHIQNEQSTKVVHKTSSYSNASELGIGKKLPSPPPQKLYLYDNNVEQKKMTALPKMLTRHIFSFLEPQDLVHRASLINKNCNQIANSLIKNIFVVVDYDIYEPSRFAS